MKEPCTSRGAGRGRFLRGAWVGSVGAGRRRPVEGPASSAWGGCDGPGCGACEGPGCGACEGPGCGACEGPGCGSSGSAGTRRGAAVGG